MLYLRCPVVCRLRFAPSLLLPVWWPWQGSAYFVRSFTAYRGRSGVLLYMNGHFLSLAASGTLP